jgi:hypothetical protein
MIRRPNWGKTQKFSHFPTKIDLGIESFGCSSKTKQGIMTEPEVISDRAAGGHLAVKPAIPVGYKRQTISGL